MDSSMAYNVYGDGLPNSILNTEQPIHVNLLSTDFPKDTEYGESLTDMFDSLFEPLLEVKSLGQVGYESCRTDWEDQTENQQKWWNNFAESIRVEVIKREKVEDLENTIIEDSKEIDELKKKIQELLLDGGRTEQALAWEKVCKVLHNTIPGWSRLGLTGSESACTAIKNLADENTRLREGKFTPDELQNICHNLTPSDKHAFCNGCDEKQRKLFGNSRTDDLCVAMTILQEKLDALAKTMFFVEDRLSTLERNRHLP